MATHSNGIAALQLQAQLALGSYKSAWLLCAKLRRAMVAPGRVPLSGLVEVDETAIPLRRKDDPPAGGHGRSHQGKMLVAGAVEVHDRHAAFRSLLSISITIKPATYQHADPTGSKGISLLRYSNPGFSAQIAAISSVYQNVCF